MNLKKISIGAKNPVAVTVLLVVLVTAVVNSGAVIYLVHQVHSLRNQTQTLNNQHFADLVTKAAEVINRPIVIDPISGKAYIPEARLLLPPPSADFGGITYNYEPADKNFPAELHLASGSAVSAAAQPLLSVDSNVNATLGAVPKLQACIRGVTIEFQSQQESKLAAKKSLPDGRTAYFYTEQKCYNKEFLQYAEQLTSY